MKIKLLISFFLVAITCSCQIFRASSEHGKYVLPVSSLKKPAKEGKACVSGIMPFSLLFSNIDISVETARQNGGISEISAIENENMHILIYTRNCVVVRGN